jgi:hypothetical protein
MDRVVASGEANLKMSSTTKIPEGNQQTGRSFGEIVSSMTARVGVGQPKSRSGRTRRHCVVSHIPTLCELRGVGVSQTHVRAPRREWTNELTASLKK